MKNDKRKLIIKRSKELFFKFGVKKVTVEEISSLCKISKKTYYKEFKNKYALVEEILNEFALDDRLIFDKLKAAPISFRDKIIKMTELKMKKFESTESIFFNDVLNNCKELKPYVERRIAEDERDFFLFVSEEQRNNNLRKEIPASLIFHLLQKNAMALIFDPDVEKIYPNFNQRVFKIVDIVINGIDNGNSI